MHAVCALLLEKKPAAQSVQFCEVEAEYEPGEQLKHSEKPEPVVYRPALQEGHEAERFPLK